MAGIPPERGEDGGEGEGEQPVQEIARATAGRGQLVFFDALAHGETGLRLELGNPRHDGKDGG
jgi:hypothetical protein